MPINLLTNFLPGFYKTPQLKRFWARAEKLGTVRKRSWNTPDEIRKDLAWADAVLMWSWPVLDDALLDAAPKLKFSGQIDCGRLGAETALRRGLPLTLTKRCWSPAVAEMALALTLNLLRKTSTYHMAARSGKEHWVGSFPDTLDFHERELAGLPVGIVGFGAVGRRYAELLAPFRCRIRVYDPFLPPQIAEQAGVSLVELDELLRESDVVTLCAASNQGTSRLIGKKRVAMLRKGAVFVNVARAALVETDALVARLKKGDIYAAIDVFDQEPLAAKSPLRKLPNAFLTPHRAGGLITSVERALTMLLDDLEAHLAGQPRKYPLVEAMIPALDA
jgi:phosphoglycerate dehydrogenase-like enzyme